MSAVTLSDADAPAHHEGSWWQRVREHCAQEWASALLVASIVTIANLHFHSLRAFDTYTFLALGQLTSVSLAGGGKEHRAVVVEIDNPTFEKEFEEKTPLNRALLTRYLGAIYGTRDDPYLDVPPDSDEPNRTVLTKPDIVVVDLDISPALRSLLDKTTACTEAPPPEGKVFPEEALERDEAALYDLIETRARGPNPVTTVLLKPFDADDKQLACWRKRWQAWMESDTDHVVFGNGDVPVRYGVHAELSEEPESLVRVVESKATGRPLAAVHGEHARRLDPRQLLKGVQILPISEFPRAALTTELTAQLNETAKQNPHKKRVVFFGGAYGTDDLFLSAVGEIYGVEAHAAGYVSDSVDSHHVIDFVLDFLIAMLFSLAIAFFWRKYFDARLSDNAVTRELAKVWIIGLVFCVLCLVIILSFISLLMLTRGIWLSPIPLAVGMMFDSFVSGSVDQATHKFKTMRRELIERFTQPAMVVDVHVDHTISVSTDPATQEVTMREVHEELVESYAPPPPAAEHAPEHTKHRRAPRDQELAFWGARHLPRALGGDICEHLLAHKRGAAALLGIWTVLWLSTALIAFALASSG